MEDRRYIEIPGVSTHELPPLLVHGEQEGTPPEDAVGIAAEIVESEDMVQDFSASDGLTEQRKFDLAIHLAEQYRALISHWQWGDSILEWIRQCEITFETHDALRNLLHADVWPHASRSSFVTLLAEKAVPTRGVALEKAVGLRLTFRQPPPIDCFSNQFLFYLHSPIAGAAYRTWARLTPDVPGLLPPDRFHFQVLELGLS